MIPFLKMIRYPFQLSKSSLAAVGAPQTWPKVRKPPPLAATRGLHWKRVRLQARPRRFG